MRSTPDGFLLRRRFAGCWTPQRHPFGEFSERILFLARRGSQTVGRIAGIIDRHYNQFHDEKMSIWGFFECADDPEAAAALFSSVKTWVRRKGMTFMRGPLNPSTNYEVGLRLLMFGIKEKYRQLGLPMLPCWCLRILLLPWANHHHALEFT